MSLMTAKFLLMMAVAALSAKTIHACMCMPEHPQTSFCKSDFVFRGKILSKTRITDTSTPQPSRRLVYSVRPESIYRNQGDTIELKIGDAVNVRTSPFDSLCRVKSMRINKAYLITAKELGGTVEANLCSWNSLFSKLTDSQTLLLEQRNGTTEYSAACTQSPKCEVEHCTAPTKSLCRPPGQPPVDCIFSSTEDCHIKHSYCTREDGTCAWRQNEASRSSYENCARRNQ